MITKTPLYGGYVEYKSDKNVYITDGENEYGAVVEQESLGTVYTETDKSLPPTPEPEPQPEPPKQVTNEDIMAQLTAMQGEQVGAVVLDGAYKEGVNAV